MSIACIKYSCGFTKSVGQVFPSVQSKRPALLGCSGDSDIDDVVYLINYIFGGGNRPCDPDGDENPDC